MTEPADAYVPDLAHISDRIHVEPTGRRVRVRFGGKTVADSRRARVLREKGYTPVYYFPEEDVRTELLEASEHTTHCPWKGDARYRSVRVGDRVAENAVWNYPEPLDGAPDLRGLLAFYWNAMDAWYEEDEEVFVHPRDPYKRVDALRSSRHVQIVVGGVTVADSDHPVLVFETGLPTRYYLPQPEVRMDLLVPTATRTACPYKGVAEYWSVHANGAVHEDLAWVYRFPAPECPRIEGLVCFYDERVEAVIVDGERQLRPQTPWS